MSDPIYERYKARERAQDEARMAESRAQKEADERERLRLLATIPDEIEKAFRRLESIGYRDEVIKQMFRKVKRESGDIQEAATWAVGRSRHWRWTHEDEATDLFVISSDRKFWRTKGVPYPDYSTVHIPLDPSELHLDELQDLLNGLSHVGARIADVRRG